MVSAAERRHDDKTRSVLYLFAGRACEEDTQMAWHLVIPEQSSILVPLLTWMFSFCRHRVALSAELDSITQASLQRGWVFFDPREGFFLPTGFFLPPNGI